jgi:hypothetical protein
LVLETEINEELKRLNLIDGIDIEDIKYSNSGSIYTAMIEYKQTEKKILFEQDIADTDKIVNLKEE